MIYTGATLVVRKKFSAKHFWTDSAKYNCTVSWLIDWGYINVLDRQYVLLCFHLFLPLLSLHNLSYVSLCTGDITSFISTYSPTVQMVCTIGELNRYVLAQPTDTQHKVRLIITAGLRKELWLEFQKRFEVDHIIEFYTSTEGNFGIINIDNKPGSVGALPLFVPSLQNVTILKLHPETSDYLRDENDFCVECGVSEPGETVCEITKVSPFYGYRNKENSAKNS